MSPEGNMDGDGPGRAGPAYRQLYEQLRRSILSGQLRAGAQLPATRQLAAETGLSRNTVMAAFDQLRAEGYLEGRRGSGTYVSHVLPEKMFTPRSRTAVAEPATGKPARLSERGQKMVGTARMPLPAVTGASARATAFQIGLPALDEFPSDVWARLHTARVRLSARELMRYDDAAGYRPLREAIASYVATARGIRCTAGQVVVVAGSQQALEFSARILLDPGDEAWMEDPGYLGARAALVSAGARIAPIPVDDQGLRVDEGCRRSPNARLAVVTPSHQFPLGATMPLDRRLALIDWANDADAWVIEDDYDCEFRYVGRPLAALQAIDRYSRVIYVGTFSKIIFPGLRLGYVICPEELVDAFVAAHASTDVHAHLLDQAVLCDFMQSAHFSRHLRRMRILYGGRQQTLIREAQRLKGVLRVQPSEGGLHIVGWLPEHLSDGAVSEAAAEHDLHLWPLSLHCIEATPPPAVLLGYAGTKDRDIREGFLVFQRLMATRFSQRS